MAFPKYFQQEMAQLRELGAEFSQKHPSLAPMLSGAQADPDVERLLEGTAFLTALLRQKLDDELPEIVQDLMQIVAPHYLKPLPSATIQIFRPKSTVRHSMKLAPGISCASIPVEGISCLFRTCYGMEIHPLSIVDAAFVRRPGQAPLIKIVMELKGLTLSDWKPQSVRFYLADEFAQASDLYFLLRNHLKSIRLVPQIEGHPSLLERDCLRPVGFAPEERLIPCPANAFPGFGVLQDYFVLPQKFLFLDLVGWERWSSRGTGQRFEVQFELTEAPTEIPRITTKSFVLHATPAVNLFAQEADPLNVDHEKTQYPLHPAGGGSDSKWVFSVEEVRGFVQGTCEERFYRPFDSFRRANAAEPVFQVKQELSPVSGKVDFFLSVAYTSDQEMPRPETLSVKLTCTNGSLPAQLKAGDVTIHGKGCPEYLTFTNCLPPTPGAPPPIGKNLLWRLHSHLSAGLQSLERVDILKSMLELYVMPEARDPAALANRNRIGGIESVHAVSIDRLVAGMVMRGREITVKIREDHFASHGDAYLFGCALDTLFGNYASINSFTSLNVVDTHGGVRYTWSPRMGNRPLI